MGKIIIAPQYKDISGPLVYISGPIYGAPDWHSEAIGMIGINDSVHIASPRRAIETNSVFSDIEMSEQIEWADYYMKRAIMHGIVLFWFPKPINVIEQGGYAHTSRIELGRAMEMVDSKDIHVVVGIQDGFIDTQSIKKLLAYTNPNAPVVNTLHDACEKALNMCNTLVL